MADLELTMTMSRWDRIDPLLSGEVEAEGITLRYQRLPLNEIWVRQLQHDEFDVSEMSLSFALQAIPLGWGYRALPIFHNRTFSYVATLVRLGSGIRPGHPEDLKGKRVGVVDYQMTAALWTRGILEHEFGVDPRAVEWFQGRPDPVIPGATGPFTPPAGVTIHPPPNDLDTMLAGGELDALYAIFPPATGELADTSRFRPMFEDGPTESERYFAKTGIFPGHHVTIVRQRILEEHPWVAKSLLDAFTQAQRIAMERIADEPPSALIFARQMLRKQRKVFGADPYAYGLEANGRMIDVAQSFAHEHGMTPRKQPFDRLFAEGVLDS